MFVPTFMVFNIVGGSEVNFIASYFNPRGLKLFILDIDFKSGSKDIFLEHMIVNIPRQS